MRPLVCSRYHYNDDDDDDNDDVMIGQGQKEKCKQSHPRLTEGGKEFFFCLLATEQYFADQMKCENLRFEEVEEMGGGVQKWRKGENTGKRQKLRMSYEREDGRAV